MFHLGPPPQYLSCWKGAGILLHHQIKQNLNQIWEIQEPGETYPNLSAFPEEADGCKGPLLVATLWLFMESSQRKEVYSGSLRGRRNCGLKKMYNLRVAS